VTSGPGPARRGDRGSSTLELVAAVPLLITVMLVGLQLLVTALVGVATQNAARTGARAATLGEDGRAAALGSLNEALRARARVSVVRTPTASTVVVRVRVPRVLPLLPTRMSTLSRSATMPEV